MHLSCMPLLGSPTLPRQRPSRTTWISRASCARRDTVSVSASAVKVPHAGYHYAGLPRRFFEGWYCKVHIPGTHDSFAIITSIQDPGVATAASGVAVQVMGPGDGYICHFSRDTACFWADRDELRHGAGFKARPGVAGHITDGNGIRLDRMMETDQFFKHVELGFQGSYTQHTGAIVASEEGTAGEPFSSVPSASWALSISPVTGWGDSSSPRATVGWLSVMTAVEPHWQVLMSHGLANGWLDWGGRRYEFSDAPAYAEKNWGGGFPSKWAWMQCNSFDGRPGLSVTAVAARRTLALGLKGTEEDVGLMGVTLPREEGDGGGGGSERVRFLEFVPWTGELEWEVEPWGRWFVRAMNAEYEAVIEGTCGADAGTTLRVPTLSSGLAPFCRDTAAGACRLRVWRREKHGGGPLKLWGAASMASERKPVVDASSSSAALEVGGGPWPGAWSVVSAMKEPFSSLMKLPLDVSKVPKVVKPPGL